MNTMLNVPGLLWQDLGTKYEKQFNRSDEIVREAKCVHTVSAHPMSTDLSETVGGYHAIYRDDTNSLLGVVNKRFPELVQPEDSFRLLEPLLDSGEVTLETCAPFKGGVAIFGVFKIVEPYNVLGDPITHYLIIVNDHTKPDNKVAVLQTPVRIACANALSYALSSAVYQARVPVFTDYKANVDLSRNLLSNAAIAMDKLAQKSKELADIKINEEQVVMIMDEVFPFIDAPDGIESSHERANEAVEAQREVFTDCMNVDNLANFKGTAYQVYNALVDMSQHYFKSGDRAYNLDAKMQILPNFGTMDPEAAKIKKVLKLVSSM